MTDIALDDLATQVTGILRQRGFVVFHGHEDRSYLTVYKGGLGVSFYMDLLISQAGSACPEALASTCEHSLLRLSSKR